MASIVPGVRACSVRLATRSPRYASRCFTTSVRQRKQGPGAGENFEQANDPLPPKDTQNVSLTDQTPTDAMGARDSPLQEMEGEGEKKRVLQAPNRAGVWSRSQQPREVAMTGPRFEQTIMDTQPRPLAAIELIHKQPVRWVDGHSTACDGGGGPLGHPRIFINLDKPQVCWCTYCGLPYANKHHRKHLESLSSNSYPLAPTNDPDQIEMPTTPSQHGEIQGHYATLKGEIEAEGIDKQPFAQR